MTFDEGYEVKEGDDLVGEGNKDTENEKIKLEVFQIMVLVGCNRRG